MLLVLLAERRTRVVLTAYPDAATSGNTARTEREEECRKGPVLTP